MEVIPAAASNNDAAVLRNSATVTTASVSSYESTVSRSTAYAVMAGPPTAPRGTIWRPSIEAV
jgi:hypothetical protein